MSIVSIIAWVFRACFRDRLSLAAENLALRQQLAVLQHKAPRPSLRRRDRIFWVWLSKVWTNWRSSLVIVKPATVVRWHRQGFRLYWRWKSRSKTPGRPKVEREIRDLIRRMSKENPTWGAPRIESELTLLGYDVAESTVSKYMVREKKPPSQTWRAFLENHVDGLASIDFFTVPTATFRVLYCFVVLCQERRRVVHFHATSHPTERWTAQQIIEAFPFDEVPRYLIRDRDSIYGEWFRRRVKNMGINEVVTAFRSPWQNPFVERVIGSIRRECLDHVIVLNETHLLRILRSYLNYYHESRTHLSLERNAPNPRTVAPRSQGRVVAIPQVGGLHHRYTRAA
jgi:transposase InsO family protein